MPRRRAASRRADEVARAAAMIGQDRILTSPLAMAGVAATVADGRWRAPRLLAGDPEAGDRPARRRRAATLRELMRAVVTGGTGTALAGVPGESHGKSGTAEFGGGDPPPTPRMVHRLPRRRGGRGARRARPLGRPVAAPIAARFFAACDAESACG